MKARCASRSYLHLISKQRKWRGVPSTTQLIQGTMQAFLQITKDYAISPSDRAFMAHGIKVHANLEAMDDELSLLEQSFNMCRCLDCGKEFDGDYTKDKILCPFSQSDNLDSAQEITGMADFLEEEKGVIILGDRKTSGSYKVAKALGFKVVNEPTGEVFKSGKRKGEPKYRKVLERKEEHIDREEWELQLNRYRLEFERRGFFPNKLMIECIVRDGNTYIARGRGIFRNVYYFEINRLPDGYIRGYFERKRQALLQALRQGYQKEICTAKENWDGLKCAKYCEVAEFCPYGKFLKQEKEVEDMAIKGLSEVRRLPRLGKIRLGIKEKKQGGVEYPKEVDYFILDPQTPSELENKKLVEEFQKRYGDKPKQIPIMIPIGDIDVVFPQFYKRYGKTTMLQCKGDGETAVCSSQEFTEGLNVVDKTETGLPIVECKGADCPYFKNRKCARVATLQVLLPEMPGSGVWQVSTGSWNSIVNLNSCLDYVKQMTGRFQMLPLVLERREQFIQQKDGTKGRRHYILHINLNISLTDLQKYAQIDSTKIMLSLPAPEESKEDILFAENEVVDVEAAPEQEPAKDYQLDKEPPQNGMQPIKAPMARKIKAIAEANRWELDKDLIPYIREIYGVERIEDIPEKYGETVYNYIRNNPN